MRGMSKKNTRRPRRQGANERAISHPPQINSLELRHSTTIRFVSNADVGLNVTFQNLLDLILLAASGTAVYDVFYTVKVRRVRVWAVPVIGNATTVTVSFDGVAAGNVGDQAIHTDTSMGVQPAHVDAKPSARSLASNYQISSATSAFELICPSGSVVDVELSYRGAYGVPVLAQNVAVAATVGSINMRGLDGLATATTKLPPQSPGGSV